MVLADVDHEDVLNPILLEKGIKSMLGVPLHIGGDVIGVLHVGTLEVRDFTEEDVELLQLVADRSAIADRPRAAIRGRTHGAAADRARAGRDRCRARAPRARGAPAGAPAAATRDILGADTCAALLLDPERNDLVARAAVGLEEEVEAGVRIPVGGGFAGRVAAERRPVILPDVDRAHVLNPILHEKGIKSMLGVPLIVRDEVIGVLHVGTLVPYDFTPDDVELLQLVGERVALAIARARLHEETVRLDQMKLNFVAIASHELRTPATSVYGILTTLRARGDELDPTVRAELEETAWEQSDRLRRLIEQLLDLSRLDARADRRCSRSRIVPRSGRSSRSSTATRTSSSTSTPGSPSSPIRSSSSASISNLVRNARQHGRPPVRVFGRAARPASPHQRERRRRRRARGDGPAPLRAASSTAAGREPVCGLAIAKAYANAHGGDLVYESDAAARGSHLVLPRG